MNLSKMFKNTLFVILAILVLSAGATQKKSTGQNENWLDFLEKKMRPPRTFHSEYSE